MERGPADDVLDPRTLSTVLAFTAFACVAFVARERGFGALRARFAEAASEGRAPTASIAPGARPATPTEAPDEAVDAVLRAPPAPTTSATTRHPVVDAAALAGFYARLDAIDARRPGAAVRVAVFGDSVVADDKIPARVRARLQARFGDGGPGFVLAAPPSRWYHQRDIALDARGFVVRSVVQDERPDDLLGYAGVAFDARDVGASVTVTLTPRAVSPRPLRVAWWYLARPGGGSFDVRTNASPAARVRADAPLAAPAEHGFTAPGGARAITLAAAPGTGPVRLYGVVVEREGGGAVVDNLGLVGSSAAALRRGDEALWRAHLARRGLDLAVFLLGANEAYRGSIDPARAQRVFEAMLATARAASVACVVMAPLDQSVVEGDALVTRPTLPLLVDAQRAAARAQGCAFWDTFAWMGGRNAAARWERSFWMEHDHVHPTAAGAVRVADAFVDALLAARPAPGATAGAAP